MQAATPHFLLISESGRTLDRGHWRFVLEPVGGGEKIEAADSEPDAQGERLELLAVVRGLEAIPGPSRVTLLTPSRYVNRGMSYGLAEWRSNDWHWERFGKMAPVKNRDLWQRVDRALAFHEVDCRLWRVDGAEDWSQSKPLAGPHFLGRERGARVSPSGYWATFEDGATPQVFPESTVKSQKPSRKSFDLGCTIRRQRVKLWRRVATIGGSLILRLRQLGTGFALPPWLE